MRYASAMHTVYVIIAEGEYSSTSVVAIYTSKAEAEQRLAAESAKPDGFLYTLEEWPTDGSSEKR